MVDLDKQEAVVATCTDPAQDIISVVEYSHQHNLMAYFKSASNTDLKVNVSIGKSKYTYNLKPSSLTCREIYMLPVSPGQTV